MPGPKQNKLPKSEFEPKSPVIYAAKTSLSERLRSDNSLKPYYKHTENTAEFYKLKTLQSPLSQLANYQLRHFSKQKEFSIIKFSNFSLKTIVKKMST